MTFEAYLAGKKIDSDQFKQAEAARWESFRLLFEQVHPESFTSQKKFLINDLRRRYRLKEAEKPAVPTPVTSSAAGTSAQPVVKRPVVVRKPTGESSN